MSNYAKLGYGCMTNMDILVSNAKYFPLRSAIYEKPYSERVFSEKKPDKTQEKKMETEDYKPEPSCCGR